MHTTTTKLVQQSHREAVAATKQSFEANAADIKRAMFGDAASKSENA